MKQEKAVATCNRLHGVHKIAYRGQYKLYINSYLLGDIVILISSATKINE